MRSALKLVLFMAISWVWPAQATDGGERPRLILLLAVDQLRRDRLDPTLPGGLGTILSGRSYTEGQLDHGVTNTCPGHVVMLTGANPALAGVPGNSFIDRETFETRYCVDDANNDYRVFGGTDNRSPRNIRVDGFGDWLKAENPVSKVFSIGGKDRAAIALGGQQPDGVFWYHRETGKFTTSSGYYASKLPTYLTEFNGVKPEVNGHLAELPELWQHDPGELRPDDFAGENDEFSRTSGHPLNSGDQIYEQVYRSPYLDKQTLALASLVVAEEGLGRGEGTDLLTVSLSATDTLGHSYGPRSGEAVDALQKLDQWLGDFLTDLNERIGEENILIALSADHGVAELPEYLTRQDRNRCPEQGRISVNSFVMSLYWNIYKEFSFPFNMPTKLVMFGGAGFTINTDEMMNAGIDEQHLLTWLDTYLSGLEFVERVWTREAVLNGSDETARLLRNSFVADRSADVFVQLKQDCVLYPGGGTTHGSVYDYDRDIPVVFYGQGVVPGQISGPAFSIDIAPSLAEHIGLAAPQRDGRALDLRLPEQVVDTKNQ